MTPTEQIKEALNAARMHVDCPKDRYELCTKALALLETHVLVPKEPTEEMIQAMKSEYVGPHSMRPYYMYKALVRAAIGVDCAEKLDAINTNLEEAIKVIQEDKG